MAATKVSLKLLIDKKSHRVLFAETNKKFVDFLFSIFTLPVGAVAMLLQKQNTAGSLRSLYNSIENLSDIYLQPDKDKNILLYPEVPLLFLFLDEVPPLLPSVEQSYTDRNFYRCGYEDCRYYVANEPRAICPSCRSSMNSNLRYVEYQPSVEQSYTERKVSKFCKNKKKKESCKYTRCKILAKDPGEMNWEQSYVDPPNDIKASSSGERGYVKGVITYLVMDDLDVKPMSTISAITLLTKFNVTDVGAVEEKVVDVGADEAVRLLRACLQSKTVLTDVFLPKDQNHTDNEE